MTQANFALINVMLEAARTQFAGGFLYAFAGPIPAEANTALDMGALHTECFKITVDDDGSTGLTFDAAVDGLLPKDAVEDWLGVIAFDGAEDGETTLTPTFYRFCKAADNGRGAGSVNARVQGTIGGPSSGKNIELAAATVTANGTNKQRIDSYYLDLVALA